MKKLIILVLAITSVVPVFSQQTKIIKTFHLATRAASLGEQAKIGDHVYIASDSTEYVLKVPLGRAATGTYILAQRNRYAVVNSKDMSFKNVTMNILTATGDLTAAKSINGTTGAFSSSLNVGGGFFVGENKAFITPAYGDITTEGALWVGKIASFHSDIVGCKSIRDSVSFVGSATRVAKAITGCTKSDIYVVTPRAAGEFTLPVAGDFVNVYPKRDSVVFMRAAGTTSNLMIYFMRIK